MAIEFIAPSYEVKIKGKLFGTIQAGKFITNPFDVEGHVVATSKDLRQIADKMEEMEKQNQKPAS